MDCILINVPAATNFEGIIINTKKVTNLITALILTLGCILHSATLDASIVSSTFIRPWAGGAAVLMKSTTCNTLPSDYLVFNAMSIQGSYITPDPSENIPLTLLFVRLVPQNNTTCLHDEGYFWPHLPGLYEKTGFHSWTPYVGTPYEWQTFFTYWGYQ